MARSALVVLLLGLTLLSGCAEPVPRDNSARILAMGDSLMAWNAPSRARVSDRIENILGEPVVDRSVVGARIFYHLPVSGALGMNISQQYRPGAWDWVILNGGGNDLWFGCGCRACERRMTRMIGPDGQEGSVPDLVRQIRGSGAQVIYLGYLRSPGVGSLIEHCRNEGDEFERRLAAMARKDPGVHFVSLADMVPYGDRSYHSFDMIHPSPKATREIAGRVAAIMR
ncbi:MAG: SGNH/GDSL hydrolase family protein [Pseudomonadota bacterium]